MDINLLATPRGKHFNPLDSNAERGPRGRIIRTALSRGGAPGDPANIAYPARSSGASEAMLGVESVGKLAIAVGHGSPNTTTIDGGVDIDITDNFEAGTASTAHADGTRWTSFGWSAVAGTFSAVWARVIKSSDMTDNKIINLPNSTGNAGRSSIAVFVYDNPSGKSFEVDNHIGVTNKFQKRVNTLSADQFTYNTLACKITKDDGYPFVSDQYYIAVSGYYQSGTSQTATNYHYFSATDVNSEAHVRATTFWKESPGAQFLIGLVGSSYSNWVRTPDAEFRIVIGKGGMFMNQEIGANGFWRYTESGATNMNLTYFTTVARINYI